MKKEYLFVLIMSVIALSRSFSQEDQIYSSGEEYNAVQVVVPFLTIAPDSRAGALGDAGVATSPDINSQHWNPAKYVFCKNEAGAALSYTPWLRKLVPEIDLAYLSGFKKVGKRKDQAISLSLLYFSLGSIPATDDQGGFIRLINPHEYAIDAAYSRKFSDYISGALAFRFIYSDLTSGIVTGGGESHPGISVASDVATYYNKDVSFGDKSGNLALGLNISNIGNKMSYTESQDKGFIPINLRLGTAVSVDLDEYNMMTFILDFNKLLVPTNPVYDENNSDSIISGLDPNVGVPVGMVHSFYDSPGGFKEEMNEITTSLGLEYWYAKQFAARVGYFYEHQNKGNRKYFTAGVGVKYNVLSLDFAYLVPTSGRNSPLANTVRVTLNFDFGAPQ